METESALETDGFCPILPRMAETEPFEGHSPDNSSQIPDGLLIFRDAEIKFTGSVSPDSTQALTGLSVSEGVLQPESCNAKSFEPLVVDNNSSLKGNDTGNDGKSPMQVDCKSSSSEDDESDAADDGETVNYLSHCNPYFGDYYYHNRRVSRYFNQYHPSFNGGVWGRDDGYPYREYWRREPPGLSVSMLKVEPTGLGAGLLNLGNTCFLNAILQCFTHTVPLVKALQSCSHASSSNGGCEEFCVLCALREHIDLSLKSSGKVLSPSKFFDNLTHISSCFRRYQQEDAHEFLQCLLDRLERCCLDSGSNGESSSSLDDNMVQRVFGGRLVSKLRCCNCGQCSDKYEPLVDLSLEIEDAHTLQNALESFTKVETIDDPETKFTCENCKEEASREKQLMIDQAPLVATFHLKRFKSDGSAVEKIGKHVEFPLELDLKPYTKSSADSNMELKYQLYAIVVHNGSLPTSGHYFSYIRSSPETWHKLDDSTVVQVEEEFVLSQAAYILFYAKDGTPWFSDMMEIEMHRVDSSISNTSPKSVLENVDGESTSYHSGASTAANIDDREAATTSDVKPMLEGIQISDIKDADEVELILEVIPINDTRDSTKGKSFNVSGESRPGGSNESGGDTTDGTPLVATGCSNAVRINEKKSVQAVLNCKENESFQENKVIEEGDSQPPTSSRFVSRGNSHGKPERRGEDRLKVENRVNFKRSPRKGARSPGKGGITSQRKEAIRLIQNMGNSSKRKKFMALLPQSEKKKRTGSTPRKDRLVHEEGQVRICRGRKDFNTVKRTCLFQGA